jgi:tRNA U34 5-carboxymethylaminomethyl modifying enzyme MnmG/GidA
MQDETTMLSPEIDFSEITGLSYELKERLKEARPMTVVSLRFDCFDHPLTR